MPNHLIHENSPYLLQHAANPVDWYPWSQEALDRASAENKPIFLSIGYAACHWCHVMAHESFEDPTTAALMNEYFVNIKVDREERIDLDNIYMQAVVAMTGQGGWPMSVFLTPEGQPFYGGTYFPPTRRYNLPSFQEILLAIARLWQQDRQKLKQSAQQITHYIIASEQTSTPPHPNSTIDLNDAVSKLTKSYDWEHGGWGKAPKFPQPMIIEFLLRRATRGDNQAQDIALHALRSMAKGGLYDVVGGGFARYSTDDQWCVPHFEKMLYDNAQLALVYLHAYLISGSPIYRDTCEQTLDFIIREMLHPLGGFFSSLDADSEGIEGAYYTWTIQDIHNAIPDLSNQELIVAAYGITLEGNFEGRNVLQRKRSDEQLAAQFSIHKADIPALLYALHQQLLAYRQSRIRPATDDKIILSWNALMLTAFAEAGRYLLRSDYTAIAIRNGRFLLDNLHIDDRLLRSWRAGGARHNAFLEDYASLILALLALYQSDPNPFWFSSASALANELVANFKDPSGGFFDTRSDQPELLLRPKNLQDNATPSGNALAALALLHLHAYSGETRWYDLAMHSLKITQASASEYPTAFAQWLSAFDYAQGPSTEVAILLKPGDAQPSPFQDVLWSQYRPRFVAAIASPPASPGSPALLHNRELVNGQPAAYVCRHNVCQFPVTTTDELIKLL